MSKKQGTLNLSKIFSYALIFMVVIFSCGFLAFFTNGFTSDFKTFYVLVDGKEVLATSSGYESTHTTPLKVDIKYTFGMLNNDTSGYSVKVVPHSLANKDFDFTIDGAAYSFQAERDLTAGFEITYEKTAFSIKPKGTVTEILKAVYPGSEISDCKDKAYVNMYSLIISSYNKTSSVTIHFSVVQKPASVILDQEVIIF